MRTATATAAGLALLGVLGCSPATVERATGDGASDASRTGGIRADGKSAAVPSASAREPDLVDRTRPRGTDDWKLESPPAHHRIEAYSSLASGVPGVRVDL